MVRQEEIRGLNAHFGIHLVGLGIEELVEGMRPYLEGEG